MRYVILTLLGLSEVLFNDKAARIPVKTRNSQCATRNDSNSPLTPLTTTIHFKLDPISSIDPAPPAPPARR
jgi:hypothetical protein